jgi:hypothetical protein
MSAVFLENSSKKKYCGNGSTLASAEETSFSEETRLWKRINCTAPIIYEYYDPENFHSSNTFEIGDAKLCNYSYGGMCLELKRPLKLNLPVYIRINDAITIPDLECNHGYHVEVMWCRHPISKKNRIFRIGVQFYESPCPLKR